MRVPGATSDRDAVSDLVHRYAMLVRERRGDEVAGLFATHAVYEMREVDPVDRDAPTRLRSRLEGPVDIAAYVARSGAGPVRLYPLIHNLIIDVKGQIAHATCLMQSKTFPPGNEVFGEYDDHFVHDGTDWRFASRTYTILDAPWLREAG